MATKYQNRRDTAANWTTANTVLSDGEFGIESDEGRFKIGDGTTAWADLPYASPSVLLIENGAAVPVGTPVGTLVFEKAVVV